MKRLFAVSLFVFSFVSLTAGIWFNAFAGNESNNSGGALSIERRAVYQQKIEAVYWRHRVWNNPQPKPSLEEVLPPAAIRTRVEESLRKSNALETIFRRPVTPEQLRAEVERMARQTRNPEMLRELFAALDDDSFLIAEILARPALTEIFLKDLYFADKRFQPESGKDASAKSENPRDEAAFESWWLEHKSEFGTEINASAQPFELPSIAPAADDTWESMVTTPSGGTDAASVWTGVEVIFWKGGNTGDTRGGTRYNPALDMTFQVSRTNAPPQRTTHTAVWSGQEMIIWGGHNGESDAFRAAWRYNPTTDAWTQSGTTNAPEIRDAHVAVWTGQEMIVWGGWTPLGVNLNSGGRYNPATDTWTPTSQTNAPAGRLRPTAIWTGTEMIVWGGIVNNTFPFQSTNTGSRFNPSTGVWRPTTLLKAPDQRDGHTAVWTGSQMIIWGGVLDPIALYTNTGGIYNVETAQPTGALYDFDGDGKSDIGVFRQGAWYLQQSTAGFAAVNFGVASDKIVPADYDGDGKTDIAVYRGSDWYYLQSSNNQFRAVHFGVSEDIPQAGDFDADGKADFAVFRPSNGTWYMQQSTNGFTGIQFGTNGDKAVAADYDGDGKFDVAVYRSGTWFVLQSRDGFRAIQFGIAADKPVVSDYDGDGKSDFAVYRDGTWYVQRSRTGFTAAQFGLSSDIPAPADYDGDGKTDLAVFRNGTWYLQQSAAGFAGVQFGQNGDVPVPASF